MYVLHEVVANSNLPHSVSSFSQVSPNSPFGKYIMTMRTRCLLSRLAKQIIRWFEDTKAEGKEFDYRFTGKDSTLFLHNFMILISCLGNDEKKGTWQQNHFSYPCIYLSLFKGLYLYLPILISQTTRLHRSNNSVLTTSGLIVFFSMSILLCGPLVMLFSPTLKT